MNTNIDFNLMNSKREKFRVEIRKSLQAKDLEDRRFRVIKKSSIENKENMIYNIFTHKEITNPVEIFQHIDANHKKGDHDQLLQSLIALNHFINQQDESFRKKFFLNQMPKKLAQIITEKNHDKKISKEISSIFIKITGIWTTEEMQPYQKEIILMFNYMLTVDCVEGESVDILINIINGVSNLCYDSPEFVLRVLETATLLENIIICYKNYDNQKINKSIIRLFFNMIENIKNPNEIEPNQVQNLFELCECLFDGFNLPGEDQKTTKQAILIAQALESLTVTFDPLLIYDIIGEDASFYLELFDIIDLSDKSQQNFLCPLLNFICNLIGLPQVDPVFFLQHGLLETIQLIFEDESTDKVKSIALEIIGNIPFESNVSSNYEAEVFGFLKNNFIDIIRGPVCETKKQLIKTLNVIFKTCDPTDKEILNYLNDKDIIHRIMECLEIEEIKIKINTLELIESILVIGVNEMARLNLTANPFAMTISQDSSFKTLEALQQNLNQHISEMTQMVFDSYFDNI